MNETIVVESQRLQQCLDPSTKVPLIKLLNDTLTLKNSKVLLEKKDFKNLLENSRIAELQLMH